MGPIWGPQGPGGPRVGPMNFVICAIEPSSVTHACITRPQWVNEINYEPMYFIQSFKYHSALVTFIITNISFFVRIYLPGVGFTKPVFSDPLFSQFFRMIKTVVTCIISSSYLAGVTAAALRRHLANMNMIESIWPILLLNQNFP